VQGDRRIVTAGDDAVSLVFEERFHGIA
jgi:hypothetical protein